MGGVMAPNGEFSNFLDYASAFNYEELAMTPIVNVKSNKLDHHWANKIQLNSAAESRHG